MSKCTCEGTYAVTFCKDCGIGMDTQARALAKVDEAIKAYEGYNSNLMPFLRALRKAIERQEGYYPSYDEWRAIDMTGMYHADIDDVDSESWRDGYDYAIRMIQTEIAKEMGI